MRRIYFAVSILRTRIMSTLYVDRQDVQLHVQSQHLVIREPDAKPRHLPLALLKRVVMHGQVILDSRLLSTLAEHDITVICLSGRHGRRLAQVTGTGHHDARRRLAQYALSSDPARRIEWSRRLIAAKLAAQRRVLQVALEQRPDQRKSLVNAISQLDTLKQTLSSSVHISQILGVEGAAAAAYFSAFTTLFAPRFGFAGRKRRPPPDPVNACLSFGYTLLHFDAVTACHSAGVDPLLGFFHEPAYGRESLACDFIEPLRPRLDQWIWDLFRSRSLRAEHFNEDKGACLLSKTGRQIFYMGYESHAKVWRRYLRQQSYQFANALLAMAPVLPMADPEENL